MEDALKVGDKVVLTSDGGYIWDVPEMEGNAYSNVYGIIVRRTHAATGWYVRLFAKKTNEPLSLNDKIDDIWPFLDEEVKRYAN